MLHFKSLAEGDLFLDVCNRVKYRMVQLIKAYKTRYDWFGILFLARFKSQCFKLHTRESFHDLEAGNTEEGNTEQWSFVSRNPYKLHSGGDQCKVERWYTFPRRCHSRAVGRGSKKGGPWVGETKGKHLINPLGGGAGHWNHCWQAARYRAG